MSNNIIFNIAVCAIGILILLIHLVNIIIKRNKRKDEMILLWFFAFTVIHFSTYLTFTFIKLYYTNNAFIIFFYTVFYIMNNVEVFLLFKYAVNYIKLEPERLKKLSIMNRVFFAVFVIFDIINVFTGTFFTAINGVYTRCNFMLLSHGYQFIVFAMIIVITFINKHLTRREKVAFLLYCALPMIAIILQNRFKGYAIAYASIIVATEVLFTFLNAQKNYVIAEEKEKNKDAQIKIMLSQIQPHFIYNALSSISVLIEVDPEKAQTALDNFTEYLRHNLSSLTETKLIPFEDELKHIKSYIALEKMRFGDRLNVTYNIKTSDFYVPPLSIQPIVENAVKHGVLKKLEGGNIVINTYEEDGAFVVKVIDDGVGFSMGQIDFKSSSHVGISNIKYRVENICNGKIVINSKADKGTEIAVVFPKEVIV